MKKFLFAALCVTVMFTSCVKPSSGPVVNENLEIDKNLVTVDADGDEATVKVYSTCSWSVSADKGWVSFTPNAGYADGSFKIITEANETTTTDEATVTVSTENIHLTINVVRAGQIKEGPTLKDCKGGQYKTVYIGDQLWMAENLRVTEYSSNSERGSATLSVSTSIKITPYYADASNKDNWSKTGADYSEDLTDEQIEKLGILYNWAAAVGLTDGKIQTEPFKEPRQGICPDGWHLPTVSEVATLRSYIETTDKSGNYTAGKFLKSKSGWYEENGTDRYGFNALPSGYAEGMTVRHVGYQGMFWTADAIDYLTAGYTELSILNNVAKDLTSSKQTALAVRCVRD